MWFPVHSLYYFVCSHIFFPFLPGSSVGQRFFAFPSVALAELLRGVRRMQFLKMFLPVLLSFVLWLRVSLSSGLRAAFFKPDGWKNHAVFLKTGFSFFKKQIKIFMSFKNFYGAWFFQLSGLCCFQQIRWKRYAESQDIRGTGRDSFKNGRLRKLSGKGRNVSTGNFFTACNRL